MVRAFKVIEGDECNVTPFVLISIADCCEGSPAVAGVGKAHVFASDDSRHSDRGAIGLKGKGSEMSEGEIIRYSNQVIDGSDDSVVFVSVEEVGAILSNDVVRTTNVHRQPAIAISSNRRIEQRPPFGMFKSDARELCSAYQ